MTIDKEHFRKRAWETLCSEMDKQEDKWGACRHQPDYVWLAIETEELGEAAQAILHDNYGGKAAGTLKDEVVQIGAVAVQWLIDLLLEEMATVGGDE